MAAWQIKIFIVLKFGVRVAATRCEKPGNKTKATILSIVSLLHSMLMCVCKCVSVYDSQLLGLLLNFFKLEELFHISLLFICPFVVIVFGREERHQSDGFGQLDH